MQQQMMTTTKKVTEYSASINRGGVNLGSSYRSTYAMPSNSFFKDTTPSILSNRYESSASSAVGGLYGPGARPERLTYEKRSLSGSSLSTAVTIRDSREKEKKEICDLNDRFANYIEKVRFLDAQNRKMRNDLEVFRARMGRDTMSTKAMFECEISEAHKLIKTTETEREELVNQLPKLEAEILEYRKKYADALQGHEVDKKKIDELIVTFTGIENESNLLRRRVAELEGEVGNLKKNNISDSNMLSRIRTDVDQESLSRIDYQNRLQMLLEEIEFSSREYEQEIMDLHAVAVHDTTPENREYFKNELAGAIRNIRAEYDQVINGYRADIDSWYQLKVRELYTSSNRQNVEKGYTKQEVTRLRKQLTDLRNRLSDFEARNGLLEKQIIDINTQMNEDHASYEITLKERDEQVHHIREECEAITVELQNLLEQKQTLEAEIDQYRRLLEGEESRAGLRKLVMSAEVGDTSGGAAGSQTYTKTTTLVKSSLGGGGAVSVSGGGASIGGASGIGGASSIGGASIGGASIGGASSVGGASIGGASIGGASIGGASIGGSGGSVSASGTAQGLSSSITTATTTTTTASVIKSEAERLSEAAGELTSKIYFKGTAKGNVSIKEASVDGKFVLLENTSVTADENIGKWQLRRKVDDNPEITFTFPDDFVLKAGKSVKVWARCEGAINDPPQQIIDYNIETFHTGKNAATRLFNTKEEERAVHTQTTTQSTVIYA